MPPHFPKTSVSQTRKVKTSPVFVLADAALMPVEQATSPLTWT
jgi:hypothetical protein